MRRRRLAILTFIVLGTAAGRLAWGDRHHKAQAATDAADAADEQPFSAAEYRYRMSQAHHWRAYMLKRSER